MGVSRYRFVPNSLHLPFFFRCTHEDLKFFACDYAFKNVLTSMYMIIILNLLFNFPSWTYTKGQYANILIKLSIYLGMYEPNVLTRPQYVIVFIFHFFHTVIDWYKLYVHTRGAINLHPPFFPLSRGINTILRLLKLGLHTLCTPVIGSWTHTLHVSLPAT